MPIRLKILLGALALTLVTAAFGLYTRSAEQQLAANGFRLYDDAFMAMSYLREAQSAFLTAGSGAPLPSTLTDVVGGLEIARDRSLSPRGRRAVADLITDLGTTQTDPGRWTDQVSDLRDHFATAVELYAADAFRLRRDMGRVVEATAQGSLIALASSVLAALTITVILSHAIVPSVRAAVDVARLIACGRLDNAIAPHGRSETADLLRALALMQTAISGSLGRIQGLMDEQARNHAAIAQQQAKADALVRCFGAAIAGVFRSVSEASDQVAETAARLTGFADSIASSGREAGSQLTQSVTNIETSSAASRFLSEALRDIGREAAASETRALSTLNETAAATLRMQQTQEAAADIERMVGIISSIAGQTRMLALNATIEASRAGAAGAGFSVVAGEIKRLAQQSNAAAEAVAQCVARIMEAADAAAQGISAIDRSAHQVHAFSSSITASVSRQDNAAAELWATMWEVAVSSAQAKTGVDTTLSVTAESALGLTAIGNSAIRLARDTGGLSHEIAEFLDVIASIQSGEEMDMVALDCPATLRLGDLAHAGQVTMGSGVMLQFQPSLEVAAGVAGTLHLQAIADPLEIRVAGCDGNVTHLQPPLARAARARLQAQLAALAT